MRNPFDSEGWYNLERDGGLEEYLETHDGFFTFPLFKGIEIYEKLLKDDYLIENYSVIRLMWNIGRDDEHFLVLEDRKLEGLALSAHSGRGGSHDYKEILKEACWEAQSIKRNPKAINFILFLLV